MRTLLTRSSPSLSTRNLNVVPQVEEEEAVELLVHQFKVLLMPGTPFGAPRHLRLSYGNIPPPEVSNAVQSLYMGCKYILAVAEERRKNREKSFSKGIS